MTPVLQAPATEQELAEELEAIDRQLDATDRKQLRGRQAELQKKLHERSVGEAQERHAAAKAYKDAETELLARRDGLVTLIKDAAAAVEEYHASRARYQAARRRAERTSLRSALGSRVESIGELGAGREAIRDHELSIARSKLRAALTGGI